MDLLPKSTTKDIYSWIYWWISLSTPGILSDTLGIMHLSSAFPGWGTPGIPGGIATFYIKVTQFSEPSGMIWKQSLHPGEITKAMRQWETMAATHWRLKMSPILGQEKGPEDQKDPGTGAHSPSILADLPPVVPGSPFPGRPMTSALFWMCPQDLLDIVTLSKLKWDDMML